ncbi:MAG: hypothetical protein ACRDRO_05145 [Pseudonocardiaceae bacterium]
MPAVGSGTHNASGFQRLHATEPGDEVDDNGWCGYQGRTRVAAIHEMINGNVVELAAPTAVLVPAGVVDHPGWRVEASGPAGRVEGDAATQRLRA